MTDHLSEYARSRRRVGARRAVISVHVPDAAADLMEERGLSGARQFVADLAAELRAASTPAQVIIDLAGINDLVAELQHVPTTSPRWTEITATVERSVCAAVEALTIGGGS